MPRSFKLAFPYAIAPAVCLLLFWRVFHIWFLTDDFAWLGLPLQVHSGRDLLTALFHPYAQGTIRVLSERVYFLVLSSMFGLNPAPFRIWAMLTWFTALGLAAATGARLTGSRAAGVIAAVLWTSSVSVVRALAWASAYDQVLCAVCLLAAFYARLRWLASGHRKWIAGEWAAYLAGFGALEAMVVYPLMVALHGWCSRKQRWGNVTLLSGPAAAFTAFHLFYLPRDPNYPLVFDHRLPATLLHYAGWAIAPRWLGLFPGRFQGAGVIAAAALALALAAFVASRAHKQDRMPLFFAGWFGLALAPVLALPNNIQDYYLTIPVLGLAWLAGAGIVAAWREGWAFRAAGAVLLALYLPNSIRQIDDSLHWFADRTNQLRVIVLGLRERARAHPDSAFVLEGVTAEAYQSGFEDDPFRLFGLHRVYLRHTAGEYPIAARFAPPPDPVQVLAVTQAGLRAAQPRRYLVDVSDPAQASSLGQGWYGPEPGYRWMGRIATVTLPNPGAPAEQLHVTGYAPAIVLAKGPVIVAFRGAGHEIGSAELRRPETFSLSLPFPPDLAGADPLELTVELSRTVHVPGDPRELGLTFKTFEIR